MKIYLTFIILVVSWCLLNIYLDVKMKWNLAHIKNCPCLQEVANGSKN